MTLHLWAGFAFASLVIALVPGPGVATILGFAFGSGRRTALAAVAGMALGNAIAIGASLAGAAAILAASALAFTILKWLGATYLIVIGLIAIARSGRVAAAADARPRAIAPRAAFATTVAVGTFHPKTILFFVSFASQFIDPAAAYLPQAAILVLTFTLVAAVTDTLYALAASSAAGAIRRPAIRRWAARAGGGAMVAAGVATAAMRRG